MATLTGRWRFIEGFGEDMLGYIFPRSNAVGVPTASNPSPDDTDRFGCGHSDDGEAAAEAAGDLLNDALLALLPAPTRFEQVQVAATSGPTARCTGTRPGRAGGAVGLWVLPPGVGKVYLVRDSPLGPGRRTLRFLDVNGRPRRGRAHRRAASGVASAGTSGSTCSPTRQGSRCSRRADLRGGRRWCGAARHAGP